MFCLLLRAPSIQSLALAAMKSGLGGGNNGPWAAGCYGKLWEKFWPCGWAANHKVLQRWQHDSAPAIFLWVPSLEEEPRQLVLGQGNCGNFFATWMVLLAGKPWQCVWCLSPCRLLGLPQHEWPQAGQEPNLQRGTGVFAHASPWRWRCFPKEWFHQHHFHALPSVCKQCGHITTTVSSCPKGLL